ncbi:hypothetical protein [Histidinibacterium lentulum]|uniref:hypothetical protein n=1 Tax=Histidinibacterium lentulum TaxID=2480588 RepID=UPI000F4B720C|nr:hypothetical protein [Histidinibacterium lentulum]
MTVLKRFAAWLVSTALLLWAGVSAALDLVGRSTVTDDAALLIERIFSAPLWAQITVSVFALAWMAWVFSPDFLQYNEIKKLRKEAKAAQDRAWAFSADHHAVIDTLARLEGRLEEIQNSLVGLETRLGRVEDHIRGLPDGEAYSLSISSLRESFLSSSALHPIEQQINYVSGSVIGLEEALPELERQISMIKDEVRELGSRSSNEGETPR